MQDIVLLGLGFAACANALIPRTSPCCFHLTASGGVSGTVGQLDDGQNRIGGGLTEAEYCIDSKGAITDGNGRGCILTPPTSQFQCDTGATAQTGFSVGCDGTLEYNDNSGFVACATGDNNEDNVYTIAPAGAGSACTSIKLTADNCKSSCPAASATTACPAALTGTWEFPHLIVPVNSGSPDTAYGTSYFGEISSTVSSLFDFDIPASDSGKTCSLVFLFPKQSDLTTSSFTFSGTGNVDFCALASPATTATTYNNAPKCATDYGTTKLAPGNSYTIATFSCPAGQKVGYELKSSDTSFKYFQDYNPSPIGLYITVC